MQLQENVFDKGYAEVLIAEQHHESSVTPVGMALVRLTPAPLSISLRSFAVIFPLTLAM